MPSVEINGTDLNYRIDGRHGGPSLLFSNSLGTNLGMWDAQVQALSQRFRIIRYDSRGHGLSGAPDAEYTMDTLGRDALGLMDYLEIDRTHYCGLSKGGMVGQWLGANAGERIEKLVLSNTSSYLNNDELWNGRIAAARSAAGMDGLVDAISERWFTPGFRERDPEEVNRVRQMILTTPAHGYAGCCAAIRDMDQRAILPSIAVPTMVIVGDQDPATTPEDGTYIADNIPGARLWTIENAAHLSNIEQPGQFMDALTSFFEI